MVDYCFCGCRSARCRTDNLDRDAANKAQEAAHAAQQGLRGDITNLRVEDARTTGELNGMKDLMEGLIQTGVPGIKQFVGTITKAIRTHPRVPSALLAFNRLHLLRTR